MKIQAVLLQYSQISQVEYKEIPYIKEFDATSTMEDVDNWVKSIDSKKSIRNVYFTDAE